MDSINTRRSIRHFSKKEVEEEKIIKLLRAAMQAPSAVNQRPWDFLVIRDEKKKQDLAMTSPYAAPLARAPLAIVMLGDENNIKYLDYWHQDMAAATENLLLRAVDLGLGAVWMGVSPDETRMALVREVCGLPAHVKPFALIACGYPEKGKEENRELDRFMEERIHYETY
ncbi:nitroreductase family protein [Clostridia bacterium]|nr:nitroreductase family protein [Clostridia bacterium]